MADQPQPSVSENDTLNSGAPLSAGAEFIVDGVSLFVIRADDYASLLESAECDDMIIRCEGCGAWLDRDDQTTCTADDVNGCWAYATGAEKDAPACKCYRVCEAVKAMEATR